MKTFRRSILLAALLVLPFLTAACGKTRGPNEVPIRVKTRAYGFSTRRDLAGLNMSGCIDALRNGTRFTIKDDGTIALRTGDRPLNPSVINMSYDAEIVKLANGMFVSSLSVEYAAAVSVVKVYKLEGDWITKPGDNSGFISQIFVAELQRLHGARRSLNKGWVYLTDLSYKLENDNIKIHYKGLIAEGVIE